MGRVARALFDKPQGGARRVITLNDTIKTGWTPRVARRPRLLDGEDHRVLIAINVNRPNLLRVTRGFALSP